MCLVVTIFIASSFSLKKASSSAMKRHSQMRMAKEEATFGMGCFWAPQKTFDKIEGVTNTKVGYTGGTNKNPSYKSVCGGDGHYEAVRIEFENSLVSYDQLLDVFFDQSLDSMQAQGSEGQYQSRIVASSDAQFTAAQQRIHKFVDIASLDSNRWDDQVSRSLSLGFKVIFLYAVGAIFNVEWCTRQL